MAITWSTDLATGNTIIDTEHKELINAINQLTAACAAGKGRDEMMKTVRFLIDYTHRHFSHEEELQRKSNYPDMTNHLRYHAEFRAAVQEIAASIEKNGASVVLLGQINQKVAFWFASHIKQQDTRVAQHLKQAGIS